MHRGFCRLDKEPCRDSHRVMGMCMCARIAPRRRINSQENNLDSLQLMTGTIQDPASSYNSPGGNLYGVLCYITSSVSQPWPTRIVTKERQPRRKHAGSRKSVQLAPSTHTYVSRIDPPYISVLPFKFAA
ncbi:hypothetical protein A9K55_003979 [Cordyceps militaris]|uniref:Uncharacterized protein n=1 Tax=Cordyceps militaris TaxID=73501 RepID=A0A2H4SMS3_CORMI|nr:hypothetical protein A9K55_003979 [Cordyceps militaris]